MSLARSASAGGLSINTGAANLFTSQPAASGGLFGTAATKPATTTTTSSTAAGTLFGALATTPVTTATTAAPTANMFGAASAAAPAAGGLFGQSAASAAAPKPSLFGASAATTSAPATGGLFGGGTAAAAPAATTAAPAAGGLFGGAAAATTTAPAAGGGGLFGSAPAATAAPAASGGLFGASTAATTAPAASGGLFGASTAAAAAAPAASSGGGLFGASTAATAAPAASGGFFGSSLARPAAAATTQQQPGQTQGQGQVVPGVRIDLSNLKGTTRFNDLQESLQNTIIEIDSKIQSYIEQKNQVEAFLPAHGESLEAIPGDVKFVARKYDGVSSAMASDLQAIQSLRETVKEDAEHAQLSFKALDNQKLPAQFHTSGLWSGPGKKAGGRQDGERERGASTAENGRTDLINYFSDTGDAIGTQLRKMESNLGEIEVHMYSVQAGLLEQLQRITASSGSSSAGNGAGGDGGSSADSKVAELAAVLRDFEESILTVASVVGSARESMTGLQVGGFLGRR